MRTAGEGAGGLDNGRVHTSGWRKEYQHRSSVASVTAGSRDDVVGRRTTAMSSLDGISLANSNRCVCG